jgi:peptidylprolyl isomerase
MIMGENERLTRFALATALCLAIIPLSSCTTDGGSSNRKATVSTSDSSASSINFPVVKGAPGSAPTIIAPKDSPPASLESKDLVVGNGATVTPTSSVTVHYLLMGWKSGKIIDSSWSRGTPATFGLNQVIPGWQKGIPGMKVGGRRELLVPPSLGYGEAGSGPVGPNETLIFVVDLIAVN